MDADRASLAHSDYSDASVVSLGPSIQADGDVESVSLLPGVGERTFVRVLPRSQSTDRTGQGSSWYASVFLLVNAALGAGLLEFPKAYYDCGGLVVAIVVQAVLAIFVAGSMIILVFCAEIHSSATYQDIVYAFCGRGARIVCSALIALYSFGACVTFVIVIGDQWDAFFARVYGESFDSKWFMNRKFTISLSCVLVILPLCFPKRIDFLKYASAVGVLAVIYCALLVVVKYFIGADPADQGPIRTRPDSWSNVFAVVPVICFGYQCHLSMVPIYICTERRTLPDFSKTITVSLIICFICYTATGALGYLTFGANVKPDILSNYRPTPDVLIAVIVMAIKMYTTYPLLLFVGRAALESVWAEARGYTAPQMLTRELLRRIIITIVWFCSSLALALFIPNIKIAINFLGALAAIFIFIFPGLCLMLLLTNGYVELSCFGRYVVVLVSAVFSIALGTFIFGQVFAQSVYNAIDNS